MKEKYFLLTVSAFFVMLSTDNMSAQRGILLPEKQETCEHGDSNCTQEHQKDKIPIVLQAPPRIPDSIPKGPTGFGVSDVMLRRGSLPGASSNINGAPDVVGTFGAGESSALNGQFLEWPYYRTPFSTSSSIHIGSEYSKNAVVGIYDNNGEVSGALDSIRVYHDGHGTQGTADTTNYFWENPATHGQPSKADQMSVAEIPNQSNTNLPLRLFSPNSVTYLTARDGPFNFVTTNYSLSQAHNYYDGGTLTSTTVPTAQYAIGGLKYYSGGANPAYAGALFYPYKDPNSLTYYIRIHNHVSGWADPDKGFVFYGATADTLYTSTRNQQGKKDDGKSLLYTLPTSTTVFTKYDSVLNTIDYIRPTTVLLSGANTVEDITIKDVGWYAAFAHGHITDSTKFLKRMFNPNGCSHYSGWVSYSRANVAFDTLALGTVNSNRFVDAAVRLVDGSDVWVKGDVSDETSHPYSINTNHKNKNTPVGSDALLVVPGKTNANGVSSNFRLKIGGDANMLHLQDSGNYVSPTDPLLAGFLYRDTIASAGPGAPFPGKQDSIYLSNGLGVFDEVLYMRNYNHPREIRTLTNFSNGSFTGMPYSSTHTSVYGVGGKYNGGTDVFTRTVYGNDSTGVIEMGSGTNNQFRFHIYSGGILKNFRAGNVPGDSLVIGAGTDDPLLGNIGNTAPQFTIDRPEPLYILNDGIATGTGSYKYEAGISFKNIGVDSVTNAVLNATDGGDLHIQANSFVRFYDNPVIFNVAKKDNEIKILSDRNSIFVEKEFYFINYDIAHLTVWARGASQNNRSYPDLFNSSSPSGAVQFGENVVVQNDPAALSGSSLLLIRSENDDVMFNKKLNYLNTVGSAVSGEVMIQAGQDIYGQGVVDFKTAGERSLLFEAKKTIRFADAVNVTKTGGTRDSITFKAGYDNFSAIAPVSVWTPGSVSALRNIANPYRNRLPNRSATGGDIWFQGPVSINLNQPVSSSLDEVVTVFRAFKSVYFDNILTYQKTNGSGYNDDGGTSPVILFAETGNIEAIQGNGTKPLSFFFTAGDSSKLIIQAGNQPNKTCAAVTQYQDWRRGGTDGAEYDGNILLHNPLLVENPGTGDVLLSSARDIETQTGGYLNFSMHDVGARSGNLLMTAGRHVETHAPLLIDYPVADDEANVTIQAGRLKTDLTDCSITLCKAYEEGSSLTAAAYNGSAADPYDVSNNLSRQNLFSNGGRGNGSILFFNPINVNYRGVGTVLLTAPNGNIESDPYLHGGATGYSTHSAPIVIDHNNAQGITRLEAVDIKLHDKLDYIADLGNNLKNGQFHMFAYDSILTRSLNYTNFQDTGSVFITTAKYKAGVPCLEYDCTTGEGGIHQGHIILGYGADNDKSNTKDKIVFDFRGNPASMAGANVHILAGFEGFDKNAVTGKANSNLFANDQFGLDRDKGKAYGGNITFDYTEFYMPPGNGRLAGFTEIRTPNGNIWGKDSILYRGVNGDFLVDAGLGSVDDTRAILWIGHSCNTQNILNTRVSFNCGKTSLWRTGNIMMKGANMSFGSASGTPGRANVTFRTREGYIDIYDAFTVDSMSGDLLLYAGMDNLTSGRSNSFGDLSLRDFQYTAVERSGNVFFGADDNIMLNYGNSNSFYPTYGLTTGKGFPGDYDELAVNKPVNLYYSTSYQPEIDANVATYYVDKDGYLFYKNLLYKDPDHCNSVHRLYKSGDVQADGSCAPADNGARELLVNFETEAGGNTVKSGGFAAVASNYIDLFTRFTYLGGSGTGLGAVPGTGTLHGENVAGYGLYLKSQFNGQGYNMPESRRATCEGCGSTSKFPIQGSEYISKAIPEMTYVGFHDDARIHTQKQRSWIEAPVVEFFGHTELDAYTSRGANTKITIKSDSLIFHDSIIFDGVFRTYIDFQPYTTDPVQRNSDMRYGVINDRGPSLQYYENIGRDVEELEELGPAISMPDRGLPVLELGYQRCTPPGVTAYSTPNDHSDAGREDVPGVGGDVIVAFKHGFELPEFNTVVANNARISLLTEGGDYSEAYIHTDLLRIRNKVEFYTDPLNPDKRVGNLILDTPSQMDEWIDAGFYTRHLHTEPGSELSLSYENTLLVISTSVVGGYGKIHENVFVKNGGIVAPGYASLMESDCQSPNAQGCLRVHNLTMEEYSLLRVSIGNKSQNCYTNDKGEIISCTQMDTIFVEDTVRFMGKIPLVVMPDMEHIEPGCYLFMEYNDLEESAEYVKNLQLMKQRYGDLYFYLDFSTPGKVFFCSTAVPPVEVQRWIDLPLVEGVSYNYVKVNGERAVHNVGLNYVKGHQDFEMNLTFLSTPLKVWAKGYYSHAANDLDATSVKESDGSVTYVIRQVTEPWTISFGPGTSSAPWYMGNEGITGRKVWSYRNTLYINVPASDVVSIYNLTGVLNRKVDIPAGLNKLTLDRGMYMVTLKDGTVYKIVVQ